MADVRVLLVSGSTRSGSANTAALVTAAALAPPGVTAVLYQGLAELPAFNPDHDGERLPGPAAELRREIGAADAVLFCPPEYGGDAARQPEEPARLDRRRRRALRQARRLAQRRRSILK